MKLFRDEVTNRDYIWWSKGEVTFRKEQVLFLLEYYELLAQNRYPPEPTFGIDIATVQMIRPSWNSALNLKAEIDKRLETTKEAGEALLYEAQNGYELSPPANKALEYISGWKRKKIPYSVWKAQRKYYKSIEK